MFLKIFFINKNNILKTYSIIALILLFPMSFFYHSAVALLGMPSFLGGYFSAMGLMILLGYVYIFIFKRAKITKEIIFFYIFMSIWTIYIYIKYTLSVNISDEKLFIWGLISILANVVCFNISSNIDFNSIFLKKYLKYFLVLYSLVVFNNINNGQFYLKIQTANEGLVSYQSFALYILVVSFISLIVAKTIKEKIFVFSLSFLLLYFNGARSEFVFFVTSTVMLFALDFKPSLKNIILFIASLVITYLGIFLLNNTIGIEENRIFQLANISQSSSYLARQQLSDMAIIVIQENPLIGDYGYYVKELGLGYYAHNILSAWADFGFFGFFLFLIIPVYTTVFSILYIYKLKHPSLSLKALFVFSLSLLLGYIYAQDYTHMFLGLVIGLYVNVRKEKFEYYGKSSASYICTSKV